MDNLIFCLNATTPLFILMVLGYLFKKLGFFSDAFIKQANSFVFQVALPALVFADLASEDFYSVWNTKFVVFCFVATALSIAAAVIISLLLKNKEIRGEFSQSAYRSSAALLGIGFITNIYGNAGMAPLMIIGTVPLYNIMAVVILSLMSPETKGLDRDRIRKTLFGILKNPILIGIFLGILWSILRIPQPAFFVKTLKYLGNLATPLGLMAMGAGFSFPNCGKVLKESLLASVMKLFVFVAIFLPIAVSLGFREDYLVAILIMLGSPTTVSCYVMAKGMGHEGSLTTSVVMMTSLFSAFSVTMWLYILRSMGYI